MYQLPIQYDEPVFRPPSEARSFILQVTLGCSWNRCSYCEMYTSKKFRPRKEEELFAEIEKIAGQSPQLQKIFLADGNAMVLSAKKLLRIIEKINQNFPNIQRISSYAMPRDILAKTPEELEQLQSAGLSLLYVGMESGDDEILKKIDKGETKQTTIDGLRAAKKAGIKSSVMILNGIGGKKYIQQHAINSADVLNQTQPEFVSTLVVSFPMGTDRFTGKFGDDFIPLEQDDLFQEMALFLAHTNLEKSVFRSDHASNYLVLKGILGRDKEKLLQQVQSALQAPEYAGLRKEWQRGL
ncbi:MAG: radical SAM superfamily enzyme YgiQ (UPF0313 family) [bacterium]|jgi:radical SAM superfamily enzyme YgiQ (UPF0313 family)